MCVGQCADQLPAAPTPIGYQHDRADLRRLGDSGVLDDWLPAHPRRPRSRMWSDESSGTLPSCTPPRGSKATAFSTRAGQKGGGARRRGGRVDGHGPGWAVETGSPAMALLVVLCPADGVLLVKAWETFEPRVGAGVPDIDDEERVPAAVGEEFGVDAGGVES